MGGPQPAAAAFRELGQTVKKDHQAVGTDPSGERAIATEDTRMAMADPERASSGAQEASCCGVPVSKSRQTERMSLGQSDNQFPKAHGQSACQLDRRQLPHQLCDGIEMHFEGLGCGLVDKSAHMACTRHWV